MFNVTFEAVEYPLTSKYQVPAPGFEKVQTSSLPFRYGRQSYLDLVDLVPSLT